MIWINVARIGVIAVATASSLVYGQQRYEEVVITGKKGGGAAWYDYAVDPLSYDPFGRTVPEAGTALALKIAELLRNAANNFTPTCVPPGASEEAHRNAQAALCAAQAVAQVSAALGVAASAVSADTARNACFTEIAIKLGSNDCKSE